MLISVNCHNPSHQAGSGQIVMDQSRLKTEGITDTPFIMNYVQAHVRHLHTNTRKATFDVVVDDDKRYGQIIFNDGKVEFRTELNIFLEGAKKSLKNLVEPLRISKER